MRARALRGFCRRGEDPLGWRVQRQPLPEQHVDSRKVELDYRSTEPDSYFAHEHVYHAPAAVHRREADAKPQVYFDRVRQFSAEYRPWLYGHAGQGFFLAVYLFCWAYLWTYLRNEHQRRGKPRDRHAEFVN